MEHKWYVVRAVSGKERKVKEAIENEVARQNLEDHIPQVLIPSEKVYEMRNGKKRVRERQVSSLINFESIQHRQTDRQIYRYK